MKPSAGVLARSWLGQLEAREKEAAAQIGQFSVWLERQSYSKHTIRQYVRVISRLQAWLLDHDLPILPNTSWRDLRAYGSTLPETYASRCCLRSAMTCYWRFLDIRSDAPAWAIEQPAKPDYECRALGEGEIHLLLEAARRLGLLEYAACCALYYQGLRREECSRLRWADLTAGEVRGIGKGRREFRLPLHTEFAAALEALEPEGPWVLPGRWPGTHVSPATIWMWVRLAAERAGLGRVTPHQLRHTSIATVNDATELRTAMTWARHRDPAQTAIYTRTKIAKLRKGMGAL